MNRSPIRRRLVAVAAVALTVVAGLATTSPPAGATTARRGPVPALPRAAVPWARVGPGWYLLVDSTADPRGRPGTASLLLVSPTGSRYGIASTADDGMAGKLQGLTAWSGDGKRALFLQTRQNRNGVQTGADAIELDLRTGISRRIPVPAKTQDITYTRPDGHGLLAVEPVPPVGADSPTAIDRLSSTGHQLVQVAAGRGIGDSLYSPDGTFLVLGTRTGLATVSNSDRPIRTLQGPVGSCGVVRWWDKQHVLASCATGSGYALWLFPIDGTSPRELTAIRTTSSEPDGYDFDAWRLSGQLFAYSGGDCGTFITRQFPDGSARIITIPGDIGQNATVLGAQGNALAIVATGGCGGSDALALVNPVAGHAQVLLRSESNTLGLENVLAFPTGATAGTGTF